MELAVQTMLRWSEQGYRVGLCVGAQQFEPDSNSLEALIDKLALLDQSASKRAPTNLSSRALWLLPHGETKFSQEHQCYFVDKRGEVSAG